MFDDLSVASWRDTPGPMMGSAGADDTSIKAPSAAARRNCDELTIPHATRRAHRAASARTYLLERAACIFYGHPEERSDEGSGSLRNETRSLAPLGMTPFATSP